MTLLQHLADTELYFTPLQRHMLDALLAEGAPQHAALHAWAETVDLDDIDAASYRLIPPLYARAGTQAPLAPLAGRMKGIYRYYFYRNHKFLRRMEAVFTALLAAGIDFIIFKGVAILLQHHASAAARSAADCDILIHPRDRTRAEAILAGLGFAYRYTPDKKPFDTHSHDYVDAAGNGFDLHWHAFSENCTLGVDRNLWRRSRHILWKNLRLRVLAPEDELLAAGINAIRDINQLRGDWLYDASLIFAAAPNFRWRLLRAELRRRNLQHAFLAALGQLQRFVPNFPNRPAQRAFRAELRAAAWGATAEHRTLGLPAALQAELAQALAPTNPLRRWRGALLRRDWPAIAARDGAGLLHLRYHLHADGSVSHLRLRPALLPFLPHIFGITGPSTPPAGEIELTFPQGALILPKLTFPPGQAGVRTECRHLHFPPNLQTHRIPVRVTNHSPVPWCVFSGSLAQFGLAYHLFAENGAMLAWEFPRQYFVPARQGHAAILLPGRHADRMLAISRPPTPGRFTARLDIVQETIDWFDPESRYLPRITLTAA